MPRVVDHEQRRDEVAAVAERVIAERGLEAGLRDVAEAGGWSTSVVTHYFADKSELLEHTLRRSLESSALRIEQRVQKDEPRLAVMLEESLPIDVRRRRQWRLLIPFWGRAVHDPGLARHQRRRHQAFRAELAAALAEDPLSDPLLDPDVEARRLLALLDGIAVQAAFEPRDWPAQVQIEIVNRHLAELGLAPRLAPGRRSRAA